MPTPIDAIRPHPRNPRRIAQEALAKLCESIQRDPEFMRLRPIVVDAEGQILGGNQRWKACKALGFAELPDGWVVKADDLTDEQRRRFILVDNAPEGMAGGWDFDLLKTEWKLPELKELGFDMADLGGEPEGDADAEPQIDQAEELNKKWQVKAGDLWLIGSHRLLCGDSTKAEDVGRVISEEKADLLLTDPPYSSGGFQESHKARGSIGTKRKGADGKEYTPQIQNDSLSSRGYCALIKSVLGEWSPLWCYVFTDWRMWVQLFDVMESSGFAVRSMIVWDKGTPGMGRGWRSQHELVMFGTHAKAEFDNHKAAGNVLQSKRTGNPNHPTEKPVDILETILTVSDFCQIISDPFLGSGTTMVAAQNLGRKCYGLEISPAYCAVILQRMADAFPGIEIRRG